MLNYKFLSICVLGLVLPNSLLVASELASSKDFQLFELKVYERSVDAKEAEADLSFSRRSYGQSYLSLIPNISYSTSSSAQSSNIGDLESEDFTSSVSLSYNINQLVVSPMRQLRNSNSYDLAKVRVSSSKLSFLAKFRSELAEIKRLILVFNKSQELLEVEKVQFNKIQKKYKVGASSKLEFLRAENSFETSVLNNKIAQKDLDLRINAFKNSFKISNSEFSKFSESSILSGGENRLVSMLDKSMGNLKEFSVKSTPKYKIHQQEVKIANLNRYEQISAYFPSINLSYSKNLDDESEFVTASVGYSLNSVIKDTDHFQAALYSYKKKNFNYEKNRTEIEIKKDSILKESNENLLKYTNSQKKLKRIEEIYFLSKSSYNKGQLDYAQFLQDRQNYISTSIALINSKFNVVQNLIEIDEFTGQFSSAEYMSF